MWAPLHPHGVLLHKVHKHAAAWSLSRDHNESCQHLPNPCYNTYGVDGDAVEDSKTHCNYSSSTSNSSSTIFHPPGCLVLWLRRSHYSRLFGRKVEKKGSGEMYRNLESIAWCSSCSCCPSCHCWQALQSHLNQPPPRKFVMEVFTTFTTTASSSARRKSRGTRGRTCALTWGPN